MAEQTVHTEGPPLFLIEESFFSIYSSDCVTFILKKQCFTTSEPYHKIVISGKIAKLLLEVLMEVLQNIVSWLENKIGEEHLHKSKVRLDKLVSVDNEKKGEWRLVGYRDSDKWPHLLFGLYGCGGSSVHPLRPGICASMTFPKDDFVFIDISEHQKLLCILHAGKYI